MSRKHVCILFWIQWKVFSCHFSTNKKHCQCNYTLFTSVNSYVMTLCVRGTMWSCFERSRCGGLNLAVVFWLVMVLDQYWTACHLSPLVKALESGSSGINRSFVLVVSSLCSPAEAGYKSPGGKLGRRALSWRSDVRPAHSSPNMLQRILSKHRRKSHCQEATNGASEADWMTPLQKA